MLKQASLLVLLGVMLSACSPRAFLNKVIKDKGFIPYELPLESTRVGTILRGNNEELYLVARPEACMPETFEGRPLRWVQKTDMPNEYRRVEFGLSTEVIPMFAIGNGVINFKPSIGVQYAQSVSVEFKDPEIEYLDESVFKSFYQYGTNSICRELLRQYAFVGQGLRVAQMRFQFKDKFGGAVKLGANVGLMVDITPGVSWEIEREYTLVINTPKYIGYRMAQLEVIPQLKLNYASTVDNRGNWIFRDVDKAILDVPVTVAQSRP